MAAAVPAALVLAACLESPPAGDGPPDGAPDAAAAIDAGPAACTPVEAPFDGAELDMAIWEPFTTDGGSLQQTEGVLVLDSAPAVDDYAYIDVHTRTPTSLTGFSVVVDLGVTFEGNGDAALTVSSIVNDNYYGVAADSGVLMGIRDFGAFESFCAGTCPPYSDIVQRFWRIQDRGDELHFEFSSDEVEWVELAPPQPTPVGDHIVSLWAESGAGNRATAAIQQLTATCQ